VTKASKADRNRRACNGRRPLSALAVGALMLTALPGCTSLSDFHFPWQHDTSDAHTSKEVTRDGPKDSFVMRGNGLERTDNFWHPRQRDLADAKQLLEEKKLEDAEKAFHVISADTKCPEQFREEGLYYEAECQRLQKKYRGAEETYALLFKDHPSTQFTERADRALFEIALHWLQETRQQMEGYEQQREGRRWFVAPLQFIHFTEDMPIFDCEGHAVRVLEGIQMREKIMHTPLGEQSLMYLGTLKFYREDYFEADRYFTDLYQQYPNSKNASRAIKQSIICKQLCTGGTIYDMRTVEESRKLIHTAQTAYPEFAKETDWIQKQLAGMNLQQADRDWRIAEFYRWTSHPGSAYFYYELVQRCYPNTEYAAKAAQRVQELEQRHPDAVRPGQPGVPAAQLGGPSIPAPPVPGGPAAGPTGPAPPRVLPPSVSPQSQP
jgi:outer membrane protein assembly factor BamD (BamD/ComL family)